MLQCLFHLPVFRNLIASMNHAVDWYCDLQQLFREMNNDFSLKKHRFYSPKQFLRSFAFRPGDVNLQSDPYEFCQQLFVRILETSPEAGIAIRQLFMGESFHRYMDGDELLSEGDVCEQFFDLSFEAKLFRNLEDGFKHYLAPRPADYCGHENAVAHLQKVKLPPILTLRIGRATREAGGTPSLDRRRFPFPPEFAASALGGNQGTYQLRCVIAHRSLSDGTESGHYIAYIWIDSDRQWYCFNDSTVTLADENEAIAGTFGGLSQDPMQFTATMLIYVNPQLLAAMSPDESGISAPGPRPGEPTITVAREPLSHLTPNIFSPSSNLPVQPTQTAQSNVAVQPKPNAQSNPSVQPQQLSQSNGYTRSASPLHQFSCGENFPLPVEPPVHRLQAADTNGMAPPVQPAETAPSNSPVQPKQSALSSPPVQPKQTRRSHVPVRPKQATQTNSPSQPTQTAQSNPSVQPHQLSQSNGNTRSASPLHQFSCGENFPLPVEPPVHRLEAADRNWVTPPQSTVSFSVASIMTNAKKDNKASPTCLLQGEDSSDLFWLIRNLPNEYTAKRRRSDRALPGELSRTEDRKNGYVPLKYDHRLEIFAPTGVAGMRKPEKTFELHWTSDLKQFVLLMYCTCPLVLGSSSVEVTQLSRGKYEYKMTFRRLHAIDDKAEAPRDLQAHPFFVMRHAVLNDDQVPDSIRRPYVPEGVKQQETRKNRQEHRESFGLSLVDDTNGSVILMVSDRGGTQMIKIEDLEGAPYLFGFTCVFSWALDILRQASVLSIDTTFFCLRPYNLAILQGIVANESVPLGFAVSPSENSAIYNRLYLHIEDVIRRHLTGQTDSGVNPSFRCEDGSYTLPPELAKRLLETESRTHTGIAPDLGTQFEQTPCEDPEPDDEDESKSLSYDPDMKQPMTGRPLEVPLVPDFDANALNNLPLLTDMGTALSKFVSDRQITWFLCHRHIMQSVGPKSQVGRWVKKLLHCHSETKYRHLQKQILADITNRALDGEKFAEDNLHKLLVMLGVRKDPKCVLNDINRWARWTRAQYRCPTTTNSAEGFHRHLNSCVRGYYSFFTRVKLVIAHIVKRYTNRNNWCNSSLARNEKYFDRDAHLPDNAKPNDQIAIAEADAAARFYRGLHTARGQAGPFPRQFPQQDPSLTIRREWSLLRTSLVPPDGWAVLPSNCPVKPKRLVLDLESEFQCLRGKIGLKIGWILAHDFGAAWTRIGAAMLHDIFTFAQLLGVPLDTEPPPKLWERWAEMSYDRAVELAPERKDRHIGSPDAKS
jgi:hypothetical protein